LSASSASIVVKALTKSYGDTHALAGLDLMVEAGAVTAILGPNGAGKTTLIRILATLVAPDGGQALVAGHDVVTEPARVRAHIALTGQYAALDERLTGTENLVLVGRLQGLDRKAARARASELTNRFELTDAAGRLVGTYSGGMRRRLDLAASVMVRRDIMFLDEPTTGLDPRSRLDLWDQILDLRSEGITLVLTTQNLEEADRLADHIAVINHGRVVAEGTPAELKASFGGQRIEITVADPAMLGRAEQALSGLHLGAAAIDENRHRISVPADKGVADLQRAAGALVNASVLAVDFALHQPALDDVFLALTGRPAHDDNRSEDGAVDVRTEPARSAR
jgi:ABC-2 type transport system ATP-binding protein